MAKSSVRGSGVGQRTKPANATAARTTATPGQRLASATVVTSARVEAKRAPAAPVDIHTSRAMVRQGDLLLERIAELPAGAKRVPLEGGPIIHQRQLLAQFESARQAHVASCPKAKKEALWQRIADLSPDDGPLLKELIDERLKSPGDSILKFKRRKGSHGVVLGSNSLQVAISRMLIRALHVDIVARIEQAEGLDRRTMGEIVRHLATPHFAERWIRFAGFFLDKPIGLPTMHCVRCWVLKDNEGHEFIQSKLTDVFSEFLTREEKKERGRRRLRGKIAIANEIVLGFLGKMGIVISDEYLKKIRLRPSELPGAP